MQTVTINDVAKLAGVSRATAGRVVGKYGNVSEKSKQKVLDAIRELNYTPNTLAQGLKSHSTKTIAVVIPDIKNNYCNALVYVVEKEAQKKGYSVIICNTREDISKEIMHIQNMRSRNVDGIILMSSCTTEEEIDQNNKFLYENDYPMILVDRKIYGLNRDTITTDNEAVSYDATMHLLKLGHRNIGVVATAGYSTIRERIAGYEKALQEYGIPMNDGLVSSTGRLSPDEAQVATARLLDEHPEITAIYILNNSLSSGVLLEMKKRNLAVRDDISVIVWDDEQLNQLFELTTIEQPISQIGQVACEKLFEYMNGGCGLETARTERVKSKIIYRSSCRNINDR